MTNPNEIAEKQELDLPDSDIRNRRTQLSDESSHEVGAVEILATGVDNVIGRNHLIDDVQVASPDDLFICEPDSPLVSLGHENPPSVPLRVQRS